MVLEIANFIQIANHYMAITVHSISRLVVIKTYTIIHNQNHHDRCH